jgi:tetratricopeptide (TPR) repeat protein
MTVQEAMESALRHHQAGELSQAEAIYRNVLAQNPNHPDALNLLGLLAHHAGKHEIAAGLISRAIATAPATPEFRYNLGLVYSSLGRWEEAIAAYQEAMRLRPDYAHAYNNLGILAFRFGQPDKAEQLSRKAISLLPHYPEAYNNLSNALGALGKYDEALQACRISLEQKPDFEEGHLNLGLLSLTLGDFPLGWAEYEWRWRVKQFGFASIEFDQPHWDGTELNGRRILIHDEQAFGDTIQFIRYVPMIQSRGGKVILACHPELLSLLRRMEGIEEAVAKKDAWPSFDVHCPLLSLPRVLGTTLDNIPARTPYLFAEQQKTKKWADRLADDPGSFKVGLAWAGRNYPDPFRTIPVKHLAALAGVGGVRWISLQTGDAAKQAEIPAELKLTDNSAELNTFDDTAALIANLDLVITIDTAVAHLAGAMGKPTWVLLKSAADWRWLIARQDSPWYPTMRLFRQPRMGDWDAVVKVAANQLEPTIKGLK